MFCRYGWLIPQHPRSYNSVIPTSVISKTKWSNHKSFLLLYLKPYVLGYRYYLNLDRCAYGRLVRTEDRFLHWKVVRGPNIFAVDQNCASVYYHSDEWIRYNSATMIQCRHGNETSRHHFPKVLEKCP